MLRNSKNFHPRPKRFVCTTFGRERLLWDGRRYTGPRPLPTLSKWDSIKLLLKELMASWLYFSGQEGPLVPVDRATPRPREVPVGTSAGRALACLRRAALRPQSVENRLFDGFRAAAGSAAGRQGWASNKALPSTLRGPNSRRPAARRLGLACSGPGPNDQYPSVSLPPMIEPGRCSLAAAHVAV